MKKFTRVFWATALAALLGACATTKSVDKKIAEAQAQSNQKIESVSSQVEDLQQKQQQTDVKIEQLSQSAQEALKRANDIRSARAKLKKDLKAGKTSIQSLLLDPPEYVMTAKVFDMLLAVPKYGRVKTNRILNQCRISPSKTIGGLSERQRTELVGLLRR